MVVQRGAISRRDFLKFTGGGIAVLVVGSKLGWLARSKAYAQAIPVQTLDFHITDAMKQMHTHNFLNTAECYFWIYKSNTPDLMPEYPGPTVMMTKGDSVQISLTNDLDEAHAFHCEGVTWEEGDWEDGELIGQPKYTGGPIAPGETVAGVFTASQCGTFLYYDNLNAPVNRMMGLHGGLIVLPTEDDRVPGHNLTPYGLAVTPNVQTIFDAFGDPDIYPGLKWEQGDMDTHVTPFRNYLWLAHEASPRLFAEVGSLPEGEIYDPQEFMNKFLRDFHNGVSYKALNNNPNADGQGLNAISYKPGFFTINGQTGFFGHHTPYTVPFGRVGEPVVIHILNAGLWLHSMHLHANHFYVTSVNGAPQDSPLWIDVFNIHPMDRVDYVIPFMRPPDIGTVSGIGLQVTPLTTINGHPCWPPVEEMDMFIPGIGEEKAYRPLVDMHGHLILDADGQPQRGEEIDLAVQQSPLCFPMHDHAEPSQTSQGGNYNTGMIAGMYFIGDRNTEGHMDFPMEAHMAEMLDTHNNQRGNAPNSTSPAAPPFTHGEHQE